MMRRLSCAMLSLAVVSGAYAQIEAGSDGSDGAFEPAASVEVDLSLADTGPGTGHYDPDRWAVIFHYTTVNIPGGVTVTFGHHPSGAPVVWLVDGDVTINGSVILDGEGNTGAAARPGVPGAGGFRGGRAFLSTDSEGSGGYGPGGGDYELVIGHGGGGSYGTLGGEATAGPTYGNEQIIPLIGGSGGESARNSGNRSGGAGGGAILIAATGTITLGGQIRADGGATTTCCGGYFGGGGSGGGIRLVADNVTGGGSLLARGGGGRGAGGKGRIRIEGNTISLTHAGDPVYSFAAPDLAMRCIGGVDDNSPCADPGECDSGVCLADVPLLWPPDGAPQLRATKLVVGGFDVLIPEDPHSELVFPNQDVSLDSEDPVTLHIDASYVPLDWTVEARVVGKSGESFRIDADPLTGTLEASTTTATLTLSRGFSAVQLRAYDATP